VLIPPSYLINGASSRQTERRTVTYHHIEPEVMTLCLAEGLPAESDLEMGDRAPVA
jgi:hypothetical protein